jgi:hypothetical protein
MGEFCGKNSSELKKCPKTYSKDSNILLQFSYYSIQGNLFTPGVDIS